MHEQIIQEIVEIGRRCWTRGWVASNDGNISVRTGPDEILVTASGVSKGFLDPSMIIAVDSRGRLHGKGRRPSSELAMHLRVYEHRPDVQAIVHVHPPYSTARACTGRPLVESILPEIVLTLGEVPLAGYATPSTEEVPDSLMPYLHDHNAILLANHGAISFGSTPFEAYYRMESLEHVARILHLAEQSSPLNLLDRQQVDRLLSLRASYGLTGSAPISPEGLADSHASLLTPRDRALVNAITEQLLTALQGSQTNHS